MSLGNVKKMQVQGAVELERVLKQLPKVIGQKVIIGSNRKGANVLKKELIVTAPIGPDTVKLSKKKNKNYGKLKDSIRVSVTRTGQNSINMSVHIGDAYWGMFYEFGTSRQPARPWFRKAYESKAQIIIMTITVDLKNRIEKAAEKLAGPYVKSGLRRRSRK